MTMDGRRPVKLGVVGLGGFGTLHALTVAGLAETELVAVVARRQASLDAFAAPAPTVPGYLDLDAAITRSGAEGWIVASTTASHVPLTRRLLEAGKMVLLEKPISESAVEAAALAPLVRPDSGNLMLGHVLLFNSEFRQLLDELPSCGPVRYLDAVRHRPATTLDRFPGESPFHLTMTHDLYCVQAMVDRAEPSRFSAQVHRNPAGRIDLALAQLQWSDGTLASLTASFLTPPGMGADGFDRMELFGEGWAARLSPNPRPIELYQEKARWPMALEIRADRTGASGMLAEELRCFCRVVRGTQPVPLGATYADAMQLMRWLERLEREAGVAGPSPDAA
ncbi:MAG: Gfo/Idh/MocA family oxidoreductase [Candidatus Latescibacterota bacterium]|jgi:predicted dehydrogenase